MKLAIHIDEHFSSTPEQPPTTDARAGFVLPAVLALTLMAAMVLGGVMDATRRATESASDMTARAQAFYADEAGIAHAASAVAQAIDARTSPPTTVSLMFEGRAVRATIVDLRRTLNLNTAPASSLTEAFEGLGADTATARSLSDAIVAARGAGGLTGLSDARLEPLMISDRAACLESHVSAHGGSSSLAQASAELPPADFGAPYAIVAATPLNPRLQATVSAVVRLTGDPDMPMLVHDWRREARAVAANREACWPSKIHESPR